MERHKLSVILILFASLVIYANTLSNGFVYDDDFTIVNNTFISDFGNLPLLLDKKAYFSRSEEMSYRPVVTATYFIDYSVFGLKAWGYHLTNMLLHAVNGVALYIFLSLLRTPYPFLLSAVFVFHPILTEAVNCISYREDLLAFLFTISALNIYLKIRQPTADCRSFSLTFLYLLSCLLYMLALLSKEMAVTLPLIILCYEWLEAEETIGMRSRRGFLYFIGYVMITILYLYIRFYLFFNQEEERGPFWSLAERLLTIPKTVIDYVKLSFFPLQLSADYVVNPVMSILSWSIVFVALILLILLMSVIRENRKKFLFGVLFFIVTLFPVFNIVPISNPFAERYIYLPIVGYLIAAGCVMKAIEPGHKRLASSIFILILCIFAILTVKRNTVWKSNYSLWTDTLTKVNHSSRAHGNLGVAYTKLGRKADAITEYKEAIRINPDNFEAHNNLGIAYSELGSYEASILEYRKALNLKQDFPRPHYNLGMVYCKMGRLDNAVNEYKAALRLKPDYVEAHNNLANTYWDLGRVDDAILEYKEALRLRPYIGIIHVNLGMAYKKKGMKEDAIRAFEDALALDPNDVRAKRMRDSLNSEWR